MVKINDALKIAQDADLDLVEVVPNAKPPVCKVMNYGKFKFEQNKKAQQAKKKQKQQQVKEVKLRPSTEENDYQTKLTNLRRFITDGDKAKITIRFRGRELAHKELGMKQVDRIEKVIQDKIEQELSAKIEREHAKNKKGADKAGPGLKSQKELFCTLNFAVWKKVYGMTI